MAEKTTRRMRRMSRAERRGKASMNLVSLMDVFTILVFFLLVNQGDTQNLPSPQKVQLPQSVSSKKPKETPVVVVTDTQVLVQGQVMANVDDVLNSKSIMIPALRDELVKIAAHGLGLSGSAKAEHKEVTIMGDRKIPFKLLKKIMTSCTGAGFETINLAVMQTSHSGDKKGSS
jgi:biopolymer transport protein TolR